MAAAVRALTAAAVLWGWSAIAATASGWPERVLTAQVQGQSGLRSKTISRAQAQIDEGDFEDALKTLEAGIDDPELSDEQLAEMYRLQGLAALYLGNQDKARSAFERLLQARPDYEIPKSTSPRIRELYAKIKEDIKKRRVRPVTLTLEPVDDVVQGSAVQVEAQIDDMALGAVARLFYRRAGVQSFSFVDFTRDRQVKNRYHSTLPGFELPSESSTYEVEYFVEVVDAGQRRLAGKGDPYSPMRFRAVPEGGGTSPGTKVGAVPLYQSPWFWVVVGVVVAGGVGATIAIATAQKPTGQVPVNIQVTEQP